jgi:hypothetical protein
MRVKVHQEQVEEREVSPPLAEALVDHGGMALTGRDAEAGHHLLHEVADGKQHDQQPEEVQAVLAARLHVGGDGAGVVVCLHHDQARAEDHQERQQVLLPVVADDDATGLRYGDDIVRNLFRNPRFVGAIQRF